LYIYKCTNITINYLNVFGLKTVFRGIEGRKFEELKLASTYWRNFKTKLTTKYITLKTATTEDPLKEYDYLTKEVWNTFVAQRQTPEFLVN
jgi:hypothetical protein